MDEDGRLTDGGAQRSDGGGDRRMFTPITRRSFVSRTAAAGALAGMGDLAFLQGLPSLRADESKVSPKTVQFSPDVEPLVRLLEDTERDKVLEAVADRIREGTSYQQLLSAVMLAGGP